MVTNAGDGEETAVAPEEADNNEPVAVEPPADVVADEAGATLVAADQLETPSGEATPESGAPVNGEQDAPEVVEDTPAQPPAEPDRPRRSGWWNRA